MLLLTTRPNDQFTANDIGSLYRARWRIELAFKRLKSLIGLAGPPGFDVNVAKTWVLARLLMILLLEPHTAAEPASPRRPGAASPPARTAQKTQRPKPATAMLARMGLVPAMTSLDALAGMTHKPATS